ncbi:hypothetical protein CHISP_3744 [Chitinispirillum alkaliphilum]|nr:hypothetical protein CHISP_3744 [Chitinispirillum alkaliphilum]
MSMLDAQDKMFKDIQNNVEEKEGGGISEKEVIDTIGQKVAMIKGKAPRPHMPVTIFVGEFGKNLAHMEADKDIWDGCGFDWSQFEYFRALHKELFRAISLVIVNRENVSSAVQEWRREQGNVRIERNRLIAVARIVSRKEPYMHRILKEISEGNSNMDSIQDILSLAKLMLTRIDLISGIVIGGVRIDENFLNKKREWAGELKRIVNRADAFRNVRQEEIIYRNKIILLCRQAQANINTWLDAVYFDDPGKKSKFASDFFRQQRNKSIRSANQQKSEKQL